MTVRDAITRLQAAGFKIEYAKPETPGEEKDRKRRAWQTRTPGWSEDHGAKMSAVWAKKRADREAREGQLREVVERRNRARAEAKGAPTPPAPPTGWTAERRAKLSQSLREAHARRREQIARDRAPKLIIAPRATGES